MKNAWYFIFFFISAVGYSQDVFDKMAKESCSCVQAKNLDFSKNNDLTQLQMDAGICIITSYSTHKNEISETERAGFEGTNGMRKLGEKIAMNMVNYCPDVIMAMGKRYLQEKDEDKSNEVIKADQLTVTPTISGKITAIEIKQLVTIKVKDKNSRTHNFLILEYFETASLFTENKLKVGDAITVGYEEYELYDPVSKDFKYFKVISSLEKK